MENLGRVKQQIQISLAIRKAEKEGEGRIKHYQSISLA
jgi:hypothetical protein